VAEASQVAAREAVDGLVIVDKPAGWTSHDVVARCRRIFGQRRVGHAGTLDPDATGVLVVGLGRATRLLRFLVGLPKSYTAQVVLGVATTTLDAGGEVTGRWDMGEFTLAQVKAAAATLTGTIAQVPPMVSAIHVGGRRLHELARQGVVVEREARSVVVARFDVVAATVPSSASGESGVPGESGAPGDSSGCQILSVEVDCSSGTYVRSLVADLGAALGGGAHVRSLRRTAVGPWTLADAVALDEVSLAQVMPPSAALAGQASLVAPAHLVAAIGHGKVLERADLGARGTGPWAVLGPQGDLLAVYLAHGDGRIKPAVVLAEPEPPRAR
jgi:tRNA pseudouridine55 synthase